MKNVVIYPHFTCNLACDYCWVRQLGMRSDALHPLAEWGQALSTLDAGDIVNIVGGEPTLLAGLYDFCRALPCLWAITTNQMKWAVWEPFVAKPLPNCAGITCSWHEQMPLPDFIDRMYRLSSAGYHVGWSYVSPHITKPRIAGWEGRANHAIPIESRSNGVTRPCIAGMGHIVVGPAGDIYRCQRYLMAQAKSMGNLFAGGLSYLDEPEGCSFNCVPCYEEGQFGIREPVLSLPKEAVPV